MTGFSSRAVAILMVASASFAACGKDKKSSPSSEEADSLVCESNSDCEQGWVCLDGECANTAAGAAYTDPATAVTADKVKNEVEKVQENAQKRNDELLDGL